VLYIHVTIVTGAIPFHSFILNIYTAPLPENYSEVLPTPGQLKRACALHITIVTGAISFHVIIATGAISFHVTIVTCAILFHVTIVAVYLKFVFLPVKSN